MKASFLVLTTVIATLTLTSQTKANQEKSDTKNLMNESSRKEAQKTAYTKNQSKATSYGTGGFTSAHYKQKKDIFMDHQALNQSLQSDDNSVLPDDAYSYLYDSPDIATNDSVRTDSASGAGPDYRGNNGNEGGNQTPPPSDINLLGINPGQTGDTSAAGNRTTTTGNTVAPSDDSNLAVQGTGLTGSQFISQTSNSAGSAREQTILQAIQAGNIPDFLRNFVEITIRWQGHEAVIQVAPDYMGIGTNEDFVRIPMAAPTAQRVADHFGCCIPRPKVVDAIWEAAEYKLAPQPLPPGSDMCSTEYFRRSNALIEEQLAGRPRGPLTAGNKKDIVLTNRLAQKPTSVAIYGWHRENGQPIQSLSTVHGAEYADYSHGLRLMSSRLTVDGQEMTVDEVLSNGELCGLLSNERPVTITRYPGVN